MSPDQGAVSHGDGGVVVSVDIMPTPSLVPTPVPSPSGTVPPWLAATGIEPGWMLVAAAVVLVVVGAVVVLRRRSSA